MDDTVAMQDTNGPAFNGPISKGEPSSSDSIIVEQQAAHQPGSDSSRVEWSPSAPQSPSLLSQQVNCDASSVASDGSQEHAGSTSSSTRQHGPPRRTYSSVDVDAAKQAAMSALAGLDMTTTKANLDASKAAAATARANGEVPAHVRKSNLRSVSCRQLGSGSTSGGVGKSVAFDEASKLRPADGAARTVQWRAGTSTAVDGSQPRRTTRAPASRCISLPHVLQGRAGMANRLAATYAQDAALQQQLQLLNGSTPGAHAFAGGVNQAQVGVPSMDVLSVYQLQQQAAAAGTTNGQLLSQRSFGANTMATMDDSMLQLRSNNVLRAAQQQQQQQQARLAGNWPNAAAGAGQQRVSWAPGTTQVPQHTLTNQQLLVQMHGGAQNVAAAGAAPGNDDAMWLQNPAASAALLSANRPQSLLLANQAGGAAGIPGLAASGGLLSPHLQQPAPGLAGGNQTSALVATFTSLLEQYQNVSWTVLAAAQADSSVREQLLTEVVLQLTLLHTLGGVLKSTLGPTEALSDFSYLGSAARRHIATFSRLSQAGDLAVQLLAMIAPLACRHLTSSTDVMEAAFLVLDTLALANRDVAAVVTQQRVNALSNLLVQLPMDQLLQQQTLGLAWINSMAAAVNRNKQVLESIAGVDQAGAGQPAVSAARASLLQGAGNAAGGGLPLTGLPLSSQPLMVSPTGAVTLSPTGKTPLATYFEETHNPSLVSPSGACAASNARIPGMPGLTGAVPTDGLLQDSLASFGLAGQAAAADNAAAGLSAMSLGVAPGLTPGAPGAAAGGDGSGQRSYSPLGGGLPLFGDTSLLVASNSGASGPSSSGLPAGLVGV